MFCCWGFAWFSGIISDFMLFFHIWSMSFVYPCIGKLFFLQIPPKMGGSLNLMNIQDDSRTLTPSGRTNNTSLLGINCLGLVGHN